MLRRFLLLNISIKFKFNDLLINKQLTPFWINGNEQTVAEQGRNPSEMERKPGLFFNST